MRRKDTVIRSSKNHFEFLSTGYFEVVRIKRVLLQMLDTYKKGWVGTEWDFEIREIEGSTSDTTYEYTIEVWCGITQVCIYREYIMIRLDANFVQDTRAKLEAWEHVLFSIGALGMQYAYERTVTLSREGVFELPTGIYPLTPEEL